MPINYTTYGSREWSKMRVGMLTAAYDARMDGRKAFLSAGGLVSSVVDWIDFVDEMAV